MDIFEWTSWLCAAVVSERFAAVIEKQRALLVDLTMMLATR